MFDLHPPVRIPQEKASNFYGRLWISNIWGWYGLRIWEDLKIWSERASRQVGNGSKFQASAFTTTSLECTRFLSRSSGIFFIFEDARDGEIPNLRRGGLHFGEDLSTCTLNRRCTFPERSCSSSRNRSSYSERRRGGLRWNNIMVPVGRGRAASQHLTLSLWILYKKVLFKRAGVWVQS